MISNKRNANTRKRRTARRKTRRYHGGEASDALELITQMLKHDDIKRMSKRKPVATPTTTDYRNWGSFTYFRNLYNKIKGERDNETLQYYARRRFGFTLGVWVKEQDTEIEKHLHNRGGYKGNSILFYSVEHLEALAFASGLDLNQILMIIGPASDISDPLNEAIINIAFGDSFPPDNQPLNEVGRNIFELYDGIAKERYFDAIGNPLD